MTIINKNPSKDTTIQQFVEYCETMGNPMFLVSSTDKVAGIVSFSYDRLTIYVNDDLTDIDKRYFVCNKRISNTIKSDAHVFDSIYKMLCESYNGPSDEPLIIILNELNIEYDLPTSINSINCRYALVNVGEG